MTPRVDAQGRAVDALDFPCPNCKALPGLRCVSMFGREAVHLCTARHVAASGYARRMAKKRGYSREFTPKTERHGRYLLDKIPADLWRRVRVRAKREGVSIRALILQRLTQWVDSEPR